MIIVALINLIYPIFLFPVHVEEPETMISIETVEVEPEVEPEVVVSEIYTITAYTAGAESTGKSPDHPDYGKTASGKYVQENVTAACPPELEFGTVIEIEGLGERVCHDRGGAIKGNRIDVYMPYVNEALEWGIQQREVIVHE